jgi:hypothetical protein
MPTYGLGVDEIVRRTAELERRRVEAGRAHISVSIYAVPAEHETIARLADAGVDRVLLDLPTLPLEDTLRALDALAAVARPFTS